MVEVPGFSPEYELHCPICGQTALLELCDPSGVALCPRCGLLLRRIQGRLASLYGISETIRLGTSFLKDLGADSLDIVEFVMEMEREFGVRIPEAESKQIETVEDAIRCIERHLQEEAAASAASEE